MVKIFYILTWNMSGFIIILILCKIAFAETGHVSFNGQNISVRKMSDGSVWFMQDLGGDGKGYDWRFAASKEACPTGWHLPTNGEWKSLNEIIKKEGRLVEDFSKSKMAHWWSASEHSIPYSHLWYVSGETLGSNYSHKTDAYSVRCVKNQEYRVSVQGNNDE